MDTETRTGASAFKIVAVAMGLILAAAAGGLVGVWYTARQDPDLAVRLAALPVIGGLFETTAEPVTDDEETACPLELKQALLDLRESELEAARAELDRERQELLSRSDEVAAEQQRLTSWQTELEQWELELEGRAFEIDRLVAVYAEMKPATVARVLVEMDDELAVAILDRLDESHAAKILEELEPERVARYAVRTNGQAAEGR